MSAPLEGIRVLDLTQVMAGPFCTMLLADMGADVIKIEPPGGDMSRRMGGAGMALEGDDNAPFMALNRNKRSVVLDLKSEEGREAFLALVESAGIVVESFRPGVTGRLGIDYEALSRIKPDLVYASVSGFGSTGPHAGRPGFDLLAQAASGVMSVTGELGGRPVKCGIPISDLGAGLFSAIGILSAWIHRERTGRGQHVETSLFEAALALSVWETTELWATGDVPVPCGSAHRISAPYQAFKTSDGYMVIAAITERQWQSLCEALGRSDLSRDPRFADNAARMAHREILAQAIEETLVTRDTDAWLDALVAADVPAGPIHDYEQVVNDPQAKARDMVLTFEHPIEGLLTTLGFPIKLSGSPARIRRHPPLLGEHTDEVLGGVL